MAITPFKCYLCAAMNFLYPALLGALAALAIPIIIHLFNFRRFKKVYFTNIRFLKEVKEETASRSKIKHLLVLLCRIAAIAAIVIAFAQPYIKSGNAEISKGSRAVSVYVDNSFSMDAQSNDVSLFEKAKRKAREIADAYDDPDTKFQLLTNDFEGRHQRLVNKEEYVAFVDELAISPNVRTLSSVVQRQKQALTHSNAVKNNLFVISDFQKNTVNIDTTLFKADSTYNFYFVPLQSVEQQNVYIDSAWFESPVRMLNEKCKLLVRIKNTGQNDVSNSRLTLRINNQVKALNDFSLAAQQTIVDTINFVVTENGWHQSELSISDYPIQFDDTYYFTFNVAAQISVLDLHSGKPNLYLNTLFKQISGFVLQSQSINQLDYAKLGNYQLIILDELREIPTGLASELQRYVEQGGSLFVVPAKAMNADSYNTFLRSLRTDTYGTWNANPQEIDDINTQQEVFKDVFEKIDPNMDLPQVKAAYDMTALSGAESLLKLKNGNAFLNKYSLGSGKVYLLASPLQITETTLPAHAIFVPMLYRMAVLGSKNTPIAYTIGTDQLLQTTNNAGKTEAVYKLKGQEQEFIPGQKILGTTLSLSLNNDLRQAGIYQLLLDKEPQPLDYFGFNFNRQESLLSYFGMDELKQRFTSPNVKFFDNADIDFSFLIGQIDKGIALWKWCVIAALIFLLLEILLLRFWRT